MASQQGPSAGISKSLQALNVDRASALQAQGHLPSGQGSSSRKPSAFSFLVEQPSDVTVRVVGVPATEKHNDGKTFLQVGLGGREASVLMERLGASELVHLYDFFEDNDVVGDYILTPRENPLTESGLTSQLESFAVKRELTSILTQFDAKQLAYRMFGTVSLLLLRRKREQQFPPSYGIEKVADLQREKTEAVAKSRSDFLLLMEEREKDVKSLRDQVRDLKAELGAVRSTRAASGPRSHLRTVHVMNFLQDNATVMMNWPRRRNLLDHLESATQVPREWQTVIIVMPTTISSSKLHNSSGWIRLRTTGTKRPRKAVLQVQSSTWLKTHLRRRPGPSARAPASRSPRPSQARRQLRTSLKTFHGLDRDFGRQLRPEESPMPLTSVKARAHLADYPVVWKKLPSDVQLLMKNGLEYPDALDLAGQDKCLHTRFHLYDLVLMLSMMFWRRLDDTPRTKYIPRRYLTFASTSLETLVEDKDEEYDPQQDPDDGVDDEYDDEYDDSGNGSPPSIAKRTSKRRRLSTSSAEPSTPKKSEKPRSEGQSGSDSESHAQVKSKSKDSSEVRPKSKSKRRNSGVVMNLAAKGPDNLTADEDRLIETSAPNVNSRMYFGVGMKPSDPTAHAPQQTSGFPDFIPNRHDLDLLKARCKPDELRDFLGTRPWENMMNLRRAQFYSHRRATLGDRAVNLIEDWVDLMADNAEEVWHALPWIVLDGDSSSNYIRRICARRIKNHESIKKRFPKHICYWILMSQDHTKPGINLRYFLKEKMELLDARDPARAQWALCSSDDEHIAHLPEAVRRRLIPDGKRDSIED
ncbi:uncharacterized protein IUM83_03395 [Phytophthora cinnamomi]|uniref:uncharacterized protein n=1 Tax=Phytophthora cinnamomi TaxID=4785 RepID=UPI00355AB5B3|nr:hypothetical protein IUM83_03395 [Phytophthora cinnamomi]